MRVLVSNRGDAAAYYRVIAPFSVLRLSEGLDVMFGIPVLGVAEEFDALWLQMDVGAEMELIAREFKDAGKPVIYDVDDWLFGYPPSWYNYDAYFNRGTGQHSALLRSHARLLALADVVTTTTAYLADKLRTQAQRVELLPNCVLQGDWDTLLPLRHTFDGLVVGWFGTGNHWEEWYELAPALDEALAAIGGYLSLIGAPELVTCFPRRLVERTFVADLVSMADFDQMRCAIMSFDVGLAWATDRLEVARCRSPLKAIQYGAAGVPVLASAQVYGDLLGDSYGFTFKTPQDLAAGLVQMYGDGDAWADMLLHRENWQQQVWAHHTYETQAYRWLKVLR
ncbi:MAG: hypothetical protein JXA21_06815 [Anaerolineae bacterium]|nr:hypothetical protein [Anaerolineae bacterium]